MNSISRITATLLVAAPLTLFAQSTTVPSNYPSSYKDIAIPPLHAFTPEQPKRVVLSNGVILFLQPDHELPFIDGSITIRGGAVDIPAAKTGLIDLYSEAWRTSGTATHSGDQLDDLLEAKAARIESSGDDDSTGLSFSSLKEDFDPVFDLTLDLLLHPTFKEDKLALAKQGIETGIVRRNDDASGIAAREAEKLVYGATSPYTRQPEFATVEPITVADLRQWHDKTVVAGNQIIVAVTGDFDSNQMESKLRTAFSSLPKGSPITADKASFPGPTPGVYFVEKSDVNQSNIWVVGLGTERRNPDYYALTVMNNIFSGGFGSRLVQDVRTRRGLAYSVSGGYGAGYDHPGIFRVVAGTRSSATVEATRALLENIANLKHTPPTGEELAKAKDQLLNSEIFRYDSPDKILRVKVLLEFYGYPLDLPEKFRAGIESVTAADVSRVAQKYIDPSKLAILVVGNSAEFGTPLTTLNLGPVKPLDIAIPMPPGMQNGPGGPQPSR